MVRTAAVWICARRCAVAQAIVAAGYDQPVSADQCGGQFFPRTFIDFGYGGAGDVHLTGALLMRLLFQIDQTDDLKLIQRQNDIVPFRCAVGGEAGVFRLTADSAAALRSRHNNPSFSTYVEYSTIFQTRQVRRSVDLRVRICYNSGRKGARAESRACFRRILTMKLSAFLCSYGALYDAGASTLQVVDMAAEHGFGAVEPFPCADLDTVEQARTLGAYARDRGMAVSCFSTGCELLGAGGRSALAQMKQRIDMAAAMGAPYFHHTIHPQLTLPRPDEVSFVQALREAEPLLRELCAYAADRGVECVYEDQGVYFNGVRAVERLIEELEGAKFGLVADVGNIFFVDEEPEAFIGAFSGYVRHVHCKDYLRKSGAGACPGRGWYVTRRGDYLRDTIAGHGAVNYPAVMQTLRGVGYDGWYSLEYAAMEPAETGIPMAVENLRYYYDTAQRAVVRAPRLDGVIPRFE